jgi:hypothetical protein
VLRSIGGASGVVVTLPRPSGTVSVGVSGGSDATIHRPAGVAARISVGRGASKLTFDEQCFGAIGGETRLQSPHYEGAADRYDIEVSGGPANSPLTLGDWRTERWRALATRNFEETFSRRLRMVL